MLRRFGDCCCAPTFWGLSVLLCPDVSKTVCAVSMLRHFGDCAVMLRRFGDYCYAPTFGAICCYAPTFRKLSVLMCSDISETMCCYTPTFRRLYCYASTFRTCSYIPTFRRLYDIIIRGSSLFLCT
jgi:hypothetical protein